MLRKGVKLLIKKMVDYKKALVAILENTLENVNAGNTNITKVLRLMLLYLVLKLLKRFMIGGYVR